MAQPERLKIVKFLLSLAQWQVAGCPQVEEAVNLIHNNALNGIYCDALVLFDYSTSKETSEWLQQARCLELCAQLEPKVPIVIAENKITLHERELLLEAVGTEIKFCNVEGLLGQLRVNAESQVVT